MEKGILHEVIEFEKEMQRRIETEKRTLQKWLEKVKEESDEKRVQEEENIRESFLKDVEDALDDAERKALDIVRDVTVKAERIKKLDDETLSRMVMKYIVGILPGYDRDNENV